MISASEDMPIAVRGYGVPKKRNRWSDDAPKMKIGPSGLALVFDCETTVDAAQQLRVGAYQLRSHGTVVEAGLFHDPASLTEAELMVLQAHAARAGLKLLTDREFVERIFFGIAYESNATIIGFNLGFDLSRLAVRHASARGSMRPGFSLQLSENWWWPKVRVKHLNARCSLIAFAARPQQKTPRSQRKRRRYVPIRRGFFVDVKTLAASLTGQSHSLASLSRLLDTPHKKQESDEHGEELTETYLDYLVNDVQTTFECYEVLARTYAGYELSRTLESAIYSEASIGKACLREMGVLAWRDVQPGYPAAEVGMMLVSYYGGRAEVKIRRVPTRVLYCDFLSMYATVCTLMGLWSFVISTGIEWEDATQDVRRLLSGFTVDDLADRSFWSALTTLVRVRPDADIFPVRAEYGVEHSYAIGLNYLSADRGLWFTLADVVASTILTGKVPSILEARRFRPLAAQEGLRPLNLMGRAEWRLDPYADDFYRRLIELRSGAKARKKAAEAAGDRRLADRLDAEQQGLKILASATSYGIFVELNVMEHARHQPVTCYGYQGRGFTTSSKGTERPGPFFHPLLATLITGAAHLMLAAVEALCEREGIGWALCDTDSKALARPEGMEEQEFLIRAGRICEWFQALSPYATDDPLFKIEDANYRVVDGKLTDELEPLHCLAISAKRYVLFNIDADGRPIIRKASGHGLGHLLPPYDEEHAPRSTPKSVVRLEDIGVTRWQYDVWYRIVEAALEGYPEQVRLADLPRFGNPAVSRYAATTTGLLSWFRRWNKGKPYREQVRPFGFLLAFQAKRRLEGQGSASAARAAPSDDVLPRAVSVLHKDPAGAAEHTFDRETGEPVSADRLKTYAESLAQYHLHPEAKFHSGDWVDAGVTERRHIRATAVEHIGKEANRWEEQFFLGEDPEAQIVYGQAPRDRRRTGNAERREWRKIGVRALARETGISVAEVSDIINGRRQPRPRISERLMAVARRLE